jgi:hypothetical protein
MMQGRYERWGMAVEQHLWGHLTRRERRCLLELFYQSAQASGVDAIFGFFDGYHST